MIIFKEIRYKNLLSTGAQFITIPLNESKTNLVIGENGAGKSTMLDALTYVLFGKAFRNINIPQLVNTMNETDCLVEIDFAIAKKEYTIRRGAKPSIFEIFIDGELVDQDSRVKDYQDHLEQNILKLNYKSFCQVVVLGSASFVPFMQLKPKDRRIIIEDLLDIQIFSAMNMVLKQRLTNLKDSENSVYVHLELNKEKLKVHQQHLVELKKDNKSQVKAKRDQQEKDLNEESKLVKELAQVSEEIEKLNDSIKDKDIVRKKESELNQLSVKLQNSRNKLREETMFFKENDNCPTCKQIITDSFKNTTIEAKESKIQEIEDALKILHEKWKVVEARKSQIALVEFFEIRDLEKKKIGLEISLEHVKDDLNQLEMEISTLEKKKSSKKTDETISDFELTIKGLEAEKQRLSIEKHQYDIIGSMLKDSGIKTKIIRQYVPVINKLVNKYLTTLDFFVNFTLDENFNESIKSRGRDDFSYDSFSEGEKMRIDLSLLFTWREIARLKNSSNTNLLILDEIFDSSMDSEGIENFLKMMNDVHQGVNIFVISHRGDTLHDKFDNVLKFKKQSNFTVLAGD